MIIGVTATRNGLTDVQHTAVKTHLQLLKPKVDNLRLLHGGCVGGDREVHVICREIWKENVYIVIHPASDQPATLCDWIDADALFPEKPSLERNKEIVDRVYGGTILACPKGPEELRSGTWSTIRYARKKRVTLLIFWPDGTMSHELYK